MAKTKIYKCGFRHCQHESCDVSQDEAVRIGNRYFHEDCARTYKNIEEIKRLYYEKVSNTVVIPQLIKVINTILFNKHVDSDYLLFALKHAVNTKRSIKSPFFLHYIIDDYKIKEAWKKQQINAVKQAKFEAKPSSMPTFKAVPTKEKGIENIFD